MRLIYFLRLIYILRKVLAYSVALINPYITSLVVRSAYLSRGYSSIGGEMFVPIIMVTISYILYPKHDFKESWIFRIQK